MNFVHPIEAVIPGVQGRVLAVLAGTTAELNVRTVARLAGVSPAQVSRIMPELVELGVVERREVPPSSLFRLVLEHVASRALLDLANSEELALEEMARLAAEMPAAPVSVIVFGSFARRDATAESDIDVVMVRPSGLDEDDEPWPSGVEQWRRDVSRLTGNRVEVIEVDAQEAAAKVKAPDALWSSIQRDGRIVFGIALDDLAARAHA